MANVMVSIRATLVGLVDRLASFWRRAKPAAEQEPMGLVELRHPTQCVLWEQPERLKGRSFKEFLEEIECYEDTSHLVRSLHKCRECGQLYFYEWYEWVDWDDGNDRSYTTLIPVQTPAEIEALKQASPITLIAYVPRLQWDGDRIWWNGK
jgi:hypothetical protein